MTTTENGASPSNFKKSSPTAPGVSGKVSRPAAGSVMPPIPLAADEVLRVRAKRDAVLVIPTLGLILVRRRPIRAIRTRDQRRDIPGRATRARSARGAGRRGMFQELAVSVSWPRDRDLDLDDSSASGLALDLDPSSERFDSIPEPGQSRPAPRIGSADAVIANRK
jgi:hypothetical protein